MVVLKYEGAMQRIRLISIKIEKKAKRNVLVAGIEQLSGTVYSSLYTEGSKIMGAVHGSYFPKEQARLLIISYYKICKKI